MFQFLQRSVARIAATITDRWADVEDHHLGQYRSELDDIAKTLSKSGRRVWTRFNLERKCVDLCDDSGIVASVSMDGDVGRVYRTTVRTLLGGKERALFVTSLPCVEFINTAP